MLTPGANLAFYEFANHTTATPELFSSDTHLQTTASDISSPLGVGWTGNGEPPNGLALGGAFNETEEPTPAGGQPDYFEFTITPDVGFSMSVAAFSLQIRKNDPDSKDSFAVYFDEDPDAGGDNYSTKILSGIVTSEDVFDSFSVNVESLTDLANVATPVTFRVYAWGTVGTNTMRLDNIRVQGVQETVSESALAYYGDADRLINPLDGLGNRIPDFSTAGYMYGNQPVPDVATTIAAERVVTVAPVSGDDMQSIQTAIDLVSVMPLDANGFRGVVQLTAGEFEISNQLQILASGVVLRGVGDNADAAANTILRGTGTLKRSLVVVGANSGFVSPVSGTIHNIVDKYVPVGATSFRVDSTDSWSVGDEVVVQRPSTANWISDIGMDMIPERIDGEPVVQWSVGGNFDQSYERVIERIEGDRIFLNAPLTNSFEQQYGGGTVYKYDFPRINRVGVENIRGVSDFAFDTDEDHAASFIELRAVENAWVTNVTGVHFVFATVHATGRSRMVTVDDAISLDPKSIITGARRYPFVIDGQFTLMKNLYSEEGRHDFVNNSSWRNRGPNVFLNGTAVNSHSATGPHQRWSTGTLYDTIVTDNLIEARNRGNFGSGHGWGGANMVYWNTVADSFIVQDPPTAQNWLVGSTGTLLNETRFGDQPQGTVDAHDTPVDFGRADNPTSSLFVAQLSQRVTLGLEKREYLLGDYDLSVFDGVGSSDEVFVDANWQDAVSTLAVGQSVSAFDTAAGVQYVPGSFSYSLAPTEAVAAAVVTLGLRSSGGDTSADVIRFDSLSSVRSLASLGVTDALSATETTVVSIEFVGSDLALLNDGLLNFAVSQNTVVDWASLELAVGRIDLVADGFQLTSSHVPMGIVDATYSVKNNGNASAGEFQTHVVWSPNDVVGDADDVVVAGSMQTFGPLSASAAEDRTIQLTLDRAELFRVSKIMIPEGNPVGTTGGDVSHLFLVIDSSDAITEDNESNNSGLGRALDSDEIMYFPWDTNSNGTIEPVEALSAIQSIGANDSVYDFDGNGIVTPLEALSSVKRIGYKRETAIAKTATAEAAAVTVSFDALPNVAQPISFATEQNAEAVLPQPNSNLLLLSRDDEDLFETPDAPADILNTVLLLKESEIDEVDNQYSTVDWLSVI